MRIPFRLAGAAICAAALFFTPGHAFTQGYPSKPVRLVVPYTPGGFTDTMARAVGDRLGKALGQPIVVENKPGANSIIGAEFVAKSAPDGYTLGMVIAAHSVNATLYPKLPFDSLRDFAPISLVGISPLILVANNDFPAKSIQELIAYAKANPGKVNFGSSGVGASAHLTMEYLMILTGARMTHVPYKGTSPALADLIGGQIGLMFDVPTVMMPQVKAGKIRALAMTSEQRSPLAPEVPTVIEQGVPGFVSGTWALLLGPANTPRDIVNRLSGEVAKIVRMPETRERFAALGVEPVGNTPEEATAFLQSEIAKWGRIVKEANVKPES